LKTIVCEILVVIRQQLSGNVNLRSQKFRVTKNLKRLHSVDNVCDATKTGMICAQL